MNRFLLDGPGVVLIGKDGNRGGPANIPPDELLDELKPWFGSPWKPGELAGGKNEGRAGGTKALLGLLLMLFGLLFMVGKGENTVGGG